LVDRRIENELVPLCQRYGLAILPWSPLAGGILAGRYSEDLLPDGSRAARSGDMFRDRITTRALEVARQVANLAKERNLTSAQLALLWVKDQPGVTSPIIGPRTMAHLESFLPIMDMNLADADRPVFDAMVHPGNAVADFHNSNEWMKARILD
jgi:aryl-alcohol dehydrogenase-like predicted oxidoreductase